MKDVLDDNLQRLHQRLGESHDRLREELMAALAAEGPSIRRPRWITVGRALIGETRMSKLTRLSIASAAGIVVAVSVLAVLGTRGMAFGQVMARLSDVKTVHAKITRNGGPEEVWLRRPNQMRRQHSNGTFEISSGSDLWVVDPRANTAVRKPSWYYEDAQRRGMDVVDAALQSPFERLSPLFSKRPAERIRQDGRELDVYRLIDEGSGVRAEAKVDAETHLLVSLEMTREKGGSVKVPGRPTAASRQDSQSWQVLAYDEPLSDELFTFKAAEGMTVRSEEGGSQPAAPVEAGGSVVSGRVVWAGSGQPVPGASITLAGGRVIQGPDGRWKQELHDRVKTDSKGVWRAEGVPPGVLQFYSVRVGEINWPAMPAFEGNVGSYERPKLRIDGKQTYENIDFAAHDPQELYARITVTVRDEEGKPVAGAGAVLSAGGASASLTSWPGRQYSEADGLLDDRRVWPTREPVVLRVHHRDAGTGDCRYVTYQANSKPFLVEPKKHYEFAFTLPNRRQMMLAVVDKDGKAIPDICVKCYDQESAQQIFPQPGTNERIVLTDTDGLVTLDGLAPSSRINAVATRLAGETDPHRFLEIALATIVPLVVPCDLGRTQQQITMDDQPAHMDGKLSLPPDAKVEIVYVGVGGTGTTGTAPLALPKKTAQGARYGPDGTFRIDPLPTGKVRLSCRFTDASDNTHVVIGYVTAKPGRRYVASVTSERVEIVEEEPSK